MLEQSKNVVIQELMDQLQIDDDTGDLRLQQR